MAPATVTRVPPTFAWYITFFRSTFSILSLQSVTYCDRGSDTIHRNHGARKKLINLTYPVSTATTKVMAGVMLLMVDEMVADVCFRPA